MYFVQLAQTRRVRSDRTMFVVMVRAYIGGGLPGNVRPAVRITGVGADESGAAVRMPRVR